jgi:phosphate transport system substrate-binding protein
MTVPFKYSFLRITVLSVVVFVVFMACKDESKGKDGKQTIIEGTAAVFVDETVFSIIEDEVLVFENQYRAKINLVSQPESQVINSLLTGKANIVVLSRTLSTQEAKVFENKKITPRITKFAKDAIAFIANKAGNDTLIDLQEVINVMQGKPSKIKALVFENPNSSTLRYMNELAGLKNGTKKNIYALQSHEEVLKYVSENKGSIGVVGLNLVVQPYPEWQKYTDNIEVMAVRNVKSKPNSNLYYKPNQSNIGAGLYPLTRDLYMLNYQGTAGLGMGFASFVAGEIGQRIILKSGLLPERIPTRTITVRKEILNTK